MRLPLASHLEISIVAVVALGLAGAVARAELDPEAATLASRLGSAADAVERDPRQAQELLDGLEGSAEPVTDYVLYFQGRAAQLLDDPAAARVYYERAIASRPTSPIALEAAARAAPLLLAAQQTEQLVSLARTYADGPPSASAATIALAAGEALADSQPRQAAQWLLRARTAAPGSAPGSQAASLLSDLRRLSPELRPKSAAELLEEARLAGREGDRSTQAALLDEILSHHPHDAAAPEAALARARVIAAEKGRAESAAWLESKAERASTRAAKARLLFAAASDRWNIDDTANARPLFERLAALDPGSVEAQRSLYSLGRIAESEARFASAAVNYGKAGTGPDREVARESRWRAGWVAYLNGDFPLAATRFGQIADRAGADEPAREEALYWQARSIERTGERARAELLYRTLLERFPDGFYAYLAEQRSEAAAPAPVVETLADAEGISAASWLAIRRSEVLSAARLNEFAVDELRAAAAAAGPREQRALLPVFARLGAHAQALQAALTLYRRGDVTEEQLYPFLYPHAYADIVEREAGPRGIDPYLVYSLIRQESLFDRRAVSPASAYGLMQLLISTARRMAGDDAVLSGVAPDDLFVPEINIRLGVAYLADLAQRFDRNEVLMLAGYNAGEQAAERWRARLASAERDEFIEQISYRETRDYVKKVLRNYRNYRRLYGGAAPARAESAQ